MLVKNATKVITCVETSHHQQIKQVFTKKSDKFNQPEYETTWQTLLQINTVYSKLIIP